MKMIRNKKVLLGTTLALTLSLASCGKTKKEEISLTTTEEITTEELTTQEEVKENPYEEIASESYEKYEEFYNSYGFEKDDIINVIKFLNDDREDMTEEQIIASTSLIQKALLPAELETTIAYANENIQFDTKLVEIPKLESFIKNKNIKETIIEYTKLRDKVQQEAYTGSISASTKNEVKDFAINKYLKDAENISRMYEESDSQGHCYLENELRMEIYNLATITTGEYSISNERIKNLQIAPKNDEEACLISEYIKFGSDMSDENKPKLQKLLDKLAWGKPFMQNRSILSIILNQNKEPEISKECILSTKVKKLEIIKDYLIQQAAIQRYNFEDNKYTYHI